MSNANLVLLQLCTAVIFLTGCATEQRSEVATETVCVEGKDVSEAMQMAENVLGEMHFVIDKADIEAGLITTKPLRGAQFFEFWRSDNATAYSSAEANLHTIRRTAQVKIAQKDNELCLDCSVKTERLGLPEYEVTSSARAYRMFSESSESMQVLRVSPQQKSKMQWIDLGEDKALAAEILRQIKSQITKQKGKTQ